MKCLVNLDLYSKPVAYVLFPLSLCSYFFLLFIHINSWRYNGDQLFFTRMSLFAPLSTSLSFICLFYANISSFINVLQSIFEAYTFLNLFLWMEYRIGKSTIYSLLPPLKDSSGKDSRLPHRVKLLCLPCPGCKTPQSMLLGCKGCVVQLLFTRALVLLIPIITHTVLPEFDSPAFDAIFRSIAFCFIFLAMMSILWFYRTLSFAGLLPVPTGPPARVGLTFLWIKSIVLVETAQAFTIDTMRRLGWLGADTGRELTLAILKLEAFLVLCESFLLGLWSWHVFSPFLYHRMTKAPRTPAVRAFLEVCAVWRGPRLHGERAPLLGAEGEEGTDKMPAGETAPVSSAPYLSVN